MQSCSSLVKRLGCRSTPQTLRSPRSVWRTELLARNGPARTSPTLESRWSIPGSAEPGHAHVTAGTETAALLFQECQNGSDPAVSVIQGEAGSARGRGVGQCGVHGPPPPGPGAGPAAGVGATHGTFIQTSAFEALTWVATARPLALALIVASGMVIAAGRSVSVPIDGRHRHTWAPARWAVRAPAV